MGTRSLLTFIQDSGNPLVTIYRQYDGYPEGRGKELADFLSKITMRNGYEMDDEAGTHANGLGCLAAQWIASEKDTIGNVYINEPTLDPGKDSWEEFMYTVELDVDDAIIMTARFLPKTSELLFEGPPSEYQDWLDEYLAGRREQ